MVDDFELDETEVAHGEADRIEIGVGIAESGQKLAAVGKHPIPSRGDQHRQPLHASLHSGGACQTRSAACTLGAER